MTHSYKIWHFLYRQIIIDEPKFEMMLQDNEFFKCPKSKQGLQWFRSVNEIKEAYNRQFRILYLSNPQIKHFDVIYKHFTAYSQTIKKYNFRMSKKVLNIFRIKCEICSNQTIYERHDGSPGFYLASINYYHIHTNNRHRYVEFLCARSAKFTSLMHKAFAQRDLKRESVMEGGKESELMGFLNSLPVSFKQKTKFKVMHNNFGIKRSGNNGEYMIGFFAGHNTYKKIVFFAFTVTNSQSVFAYSWIFKQFFKMMGSSPARIVTDEEKAIHYALRNLAKEGIFTGRHLFDVFHMLRKFRKNISQSSTFQLIKKLIHTKDKLMYRKVFKEAIKSIANDKQLDILRNFDLNSDNYTFSQIQPSYIGIGVSNSPNQHFHDFIKNQIPYAFQYVKAVQQILTILEQRCAFYNTPVLSKIPHQQFFQLYFLNNLSNEVSERAYTYIMLQVAKCPTLKILPDSQVKALNLTSNLESTLDKNRYYVVEQSRIYCVEKQYLGELNEKESDYRWNCLCGLESKSSYLCCHVAKVILSQDGSLLDNVSRRWKVQHEQSQYDEQLREIKYLKMNKEIEREMYNGNSPFQNDISNDDSEEIEEPEAPVTTTNQRWSPAEQLKHALFLYQNRPLFKSKSSKKFKIMSRFIKGRTPIQCQSYHRNAMHKFKNSISDLIEHYLPTISKKKLQMSEVGDEEGEGYQQSEADGLSTFGQNSDFTMRSDDIFKFNELVSNKRLPNKKKE